MRLVLLQDHLRTGGTEQQTLAIAEGLARLGVDVHLIVFRSGGDLDELARSKPFSLHFLNQGLLKTDWFAPGLNKLLATLRPDCVIPMGRMANCHAGLLRRRSNRTYALIATFRTGRRIPFLYRRALRHADHLVFNSQNALQRVSQQLGIHRPDNSSVIYNGCLRDFDTYIPTVGRAPLATPSGTLHFCSVSMFRPQKKQSRLLSICSQLPSDLSWKLTLAGTGPCLAACQAEAQRLGLSERVHFPGLLKDPRSLYSDSDIALHASDKESLPNFLVEAQMSGLPVVAFDVDGVGETFQHGTSGYLIPHKDQAAFLHALIQLSRNEGLRLQMSEAGRQYARSNFSLTAQIKAYHSLVSRLVRAS